MDGFKGPNIQLQLKINSEVSFKTLLNIKFSFFLSSNTYLILQLIYNDCHDLALVRA